MPFGEFYIIGILRAAGWPKKKFLGKEYVNLVEVDVSEKQMILWAVTLGAFRPQIALRLITAMFRGDSDWAAENLPKMCSASAIEEMRHMSMWNGSPENFLVDINTDPADTISPSNLDYATSMESTSSWNDMIKSSDRFNKNCLSGFVWGLANKKTFEEWYKNHLLDLVESRNFMLQKGMKIGPIPNLKDSVEGAEQIADELIKDYEKYYSKVPELSKQLLDDLINKFES